MNDSDLPHFYRHMADWWPLLSAVDDYAEEAEFYTRTLLSVGHAPARTLLELGAGGGNNAFHMKRSFAATLVEPAPGMQAHSRRINPECEHLTGDMRTVRLGRQFDRVFIHDAIVYMTSEDDLLAALVTANLHCRPGGGALFAPDYLKETFREATDHGGHDAGHRALRYLEWVYDPEPDDPTYIVDYAFLLREGDEVSAVHDRHIEGLFSRDAWLRLLAEAGFEAEALPLVHSEVEPGTHEVFACTKVRELTSSL